VLCEHDQSHVRVAACELEGGIQAVELRHADVDDREVGVLNVHQAHGLAAVGGFSSHDEPRTFQQLPKALPHEHMVVGEHQADGHTALRG